MLRINLVDISFMTEDTKPKVEEAAKKDEEQVPKTGSWSRRTQIEEKSIVFVTPLCVGLSSGVSLTS